MSIPTLILIAGSVMLLLGSILLLSGGPRNSDYNDC